MAKFKVNRASETAALARELAFEIIKTKRGKTAMVVGLSGDLGAGKTLFVKSFMRAIGVRKKLTSPTFVMLKKFPLKSKRYTNAYHIDAYRTNAAGLKKIGVGDIIKNSGNIVLIEWADKALSILPKGAIIVDFKYGGKQNERHITFNRR
jgi:tRNA threonylcarbamoyladenosine biosynthesis protein TsaE